MFLYTLSFEKYQDLYKIGVSTNLASRIKELEKFHGKCTPIRVFNLGTHYKKAEQLIHSLLDADRVLVNGEGKTEFFKKDNIESVVDSIVDICNGTLTEYHAMSIKPKIIENVKAPCYKSWTSQLEISDDMIACYIYVINYIKENPQKITRLSEYAIKINLGNIVPTSFEDLCYINMKYEKELLRVHIDSSHIITKFNTDIIYHLIDYKSFKLVLTERLDINDTMCENSRRKIQYITDIYDTIEKYCDLERINEN